MTEWIITYTMKGDGVKLTMRKNLPLDSKKQVKKWFSKIFNKNMQYSWIGCNQI